jgi:hypothetical protein
MHADNCPVCTASLWESKFWLTKIPPTDPNLPPFSFRQEVMTQAHYNECRRLGISHEEYVAGIELDPYLGEVFRSHYQHAHRCASEESGEPHHSPKQAEVLLPVQGTGTVAE